MEAVMETRAALERRKQEIQFLGSQYALAGVGPPEALTVEYEKLLAELAAQAKRPEPTHAPVAPRR